MNKYYMCFAQNHVEFNNCHPWLTGAADKRVKGMMPLVRDLLNFEADLKDHPESFYCCILSSIYSFRSLLKNGSHISLEKLAISLFFILLACECELTNKVFDQLKK
jgi:hypothetical protein